MLPYFFDLNKKNRTPFDKAKDQAPIPALLSELVNELQKEYTKFANPGKWKEYMNSADAQKWKESIKTLNIEKVMEYFKSANRKAVDNKKVKEKDDSAFDISIPSVDKFCLFNMVDLSAPAGFKMHFRLPFPLNQKGRELINEYVRKASDFLG